MLNNTRDNLLLLLFAVLFGFCVYIGSQIVTNETATGGVMLLGGGTPSGSYGTFSYVGACNTDTTSCQPGITVNAGDSVIIFAKWEGTVGTSANASASDGTSSFALGTRIDQNSDFHGQMLYLASSVATGSVLYTVTFPGTPAFKRLLVMVFRKSGGTVTLDDEKSGGGTSASPSSASITASGTSVCVGGYGEYSAETVSNMLIGGSAATGSQNISGTSYQWYKLDITGSGTASCTLSGSAEFICNGICLKSTL